MYRTDVKRRAFSRGQEKARTNRADWITRWDKQTSKEVKMGVQHHGKFDGTEPSLMKRFIDQADGKANRAYPNGRVAGDDEGALAFAIAADPKNQIVRIEFNKSVDWLGLDAETCERLENTLQEKRLELRGIKANC